MHEDDLWGGRPGAGHGRHRALSTRSEQRLGELGSRLPPLSEDERKWITHERSLRVVRDLMAVGLAVLLALLLAVGVAQWFRPLPHPELQVEPTSMRVPGAVPRLPWPSAGMAGLAVAGVGNLGQAGGDRPIPIAGLAGVLTAYVVLRDHPLAPGASGPSFAVTPDTLSAYQSGTAAQDSEVPVALNETLSELQALEGLLVDSGADMATLLADWDAGSTAVFVAKMNADARSLGLRSTHVTDPAGLEPTTVSTPADLIRLGEAAIDIPVFRQIVDLGQASLPMTSVVYNRNFDLYQDGIIGIEATSDGAAGGCYLFAAQQRVGQRDVTVVGAVLGQQGPSPYSNAVNAGDALVKAAFAALTPVPLLPPSHAAERLVTAWGASASLAASTVATVIGWPGLAVPVTIHLVPLAMPVAAGTRAGVLEADQNGHVDVTVLRTTGLLSGPGAFWRLTRL